MASDNPRGSAAEGEGGASGDFFSFFQNNEFFNSVKQLFVPPADEDLEANASQVTAEVFVRDHEEREVPRLPTQNLPWSVAPQTPKMEPDSPGFAPVDRHPESSRRVDIGMYPKPAPRREEPDGSPKAAIAHTEQAFSPKEISEIQKPESSHVDGRKDFSVISQGVQGPLIGLQSVPQGPDQSLDPVTTIPIAAESQIPNDDHAESQTKTKIPYRKNTQKQQEADDADEEPVLSSKKCFCIDFCVNFVTEGETVTDQVNRAEARKSQMRRLSDDAPVTAGLKEIIFGAPTVVDLNALRRSDGAIAIMAFPSYVIEAVKLQYGGDAFVEGFSNLELGANWKWAVPERKAEPVDILAAISFGFFCLVGVEILLRTFFPKNSFLYYASKNLPPKGKSVPFPGKIRSMQSAAFLVMHISSMVLRSFNMFYLGFAIHTMLLLAFGLSWSMHFCSFNVLFGWAVKKGYLKLNEASLANMAQETPFTCFGPVYDKPEKLEAPAA